MSTSEAFHGVFGSINFGRARADTTDMRRIHVAAVTATVSALVLAGCGSGGDLATDQNGRSVVTAPATKARNIVSQQNQQLQQMEQQTSQADPTVP